MKIETILIIAISAIIIGVITMIRAKASNKKELEEFDRNIKLFEKDNNIE